MMLLAYFLHKILEAFISSKVWLNVIFIVFGVCVVVYIFMIVTETSAILLLQI